MMKKVTNKAQFVHSKSATVRLNARGKFFVSLISVLFVTMGWGFVQQADASFLHVPTPQVSSYVVQSGDTLWGYAQSITPEGKNVHDTIDEIMRLNNLHSYVLHPGQSIVVPEQ
ncbi:MAG: LysM peptidoglycan-binding domain-containing protein [Bifidobacteriaceae bacterium]|nr:LysM peptidoglycan-binding domain-containing protein [Bifidobacteriaceae bacterium]